MRVVHTCSAGQGRGGTRNNVFSSEQGFRFFKFKLKSGWVFLFERKAGFFVVDAAAAQRSRAIVFSWRGMHEQCEAANTRP